MEQQVQLVLRQSHRDLQAMLQQREAAVSEKEREIADQVKPLAGRGSPVHRSSEHSVTGWLFPRDEELYLKVIWILESFRSGTHA